MPQIKQIEGVPPKIGLRPSQATNTNVLRYKESIKTTSLLLRR